MDNISKKVTILLIEDNPADALLVLETFKRTSLDFDVTHIDRLSDAISLLQHEKIIDAILLDLTLPDSQGVDTLQELLPFAPDKPILILSGIQDEQLAMEALTLGAQDYLVKGEISSRVLEIGLRKAIERQHLMQVVISKEMGIRNIIERNSDGIVIVDNDGIIRFANPAAEKLFGRPTGELTGIPFGFPVIDKDKTEIEIIQFRGNTVNVELQAVEFDWNKQSTLLVSLRNITERKKSEERIKRQIKQLNSLRQIDIAISSSFDIHITIDIVLQEVLSELQGVPNSENRIK